MSKKLNKKGKMKNIISPIRNPFFNHPLIKKSHIHDKSYKAKRRAEKVKNAKDWYSQSCFYLLKLKPILTMPILINHTH
jgi:hypothetical protein